MASAEEIARQNDLFRSTLKQDKWHRVSVTRGVAFSSDRDEIIEAVRRPSLMTKDNDPYGERDFGSVNVAGIEYFWKIDYYDEDLKFGADPYTEQVVRVLTIMKASEY